MPKASDYQFEPVLQRGPARLLVPTSPDILGPFYRPGSPFRTRVNTPTNLDLYHLTGRVTTPDGVPVDGYIEFWQANAAGQYAVWDSDYRSIQRLREGGDYFLDTIKPGSYDISEPTDPLPHLVRCPHIHVKIWRDGRDILTTQLYFPNERTNAADRWFDPSRLLLVSDTSEVKQAKFDFVVPSR